MCSAIGDARPELEPRGSERRVVVQWTSPFSYPSGMRRWADHPRGYPVTRNDISKVKKAANI